MSTNTRSVKVPCSDTCGKWGAPCGREHFVEVIDHNTTCQTTIRLLTGRTVEQTMIMDWDERRALTELLAGNSSS